MHDIYSEYDEFAWFYNKYWGGEFSRPALSIYNYILFPYLEEGDEILDLCCGTGQIDQGLLNHGFKVTGIDGSQSMLNFARKNAPDAEYIQTDARSFKLPSKFKAVISAFDSLNHIMKIEELTDVFKRVHSVLLDDGVFLFDVNQDEEAESPGSSIYMVDDDDACIVRGYYDAMEHLKRYDVTMFVKYGTTWKRSDLTLYQRYYTEDEIITTLKKSGFSKIKAYDAKREFGFNLSDGRFFYLAQK